MAGAKEALTTNYNLKVLRLASFRNKRLQGTLYVVSMWASTRKGPQKMQLKSKIKATKKCTKNGLG